MTLRHRRRRRDGHERLGLLVVSFTFPVDAVGVVAHHEDNSEKVFLALLCALFCKCGDRIYTTGNGPNRRYNNEQEPLIVEGKPIPPP